MSKVKVMEKAAKCWKETARVYAQNADYWREKYEKTKEATA